jgi:hypothetical protein
MIKALRDIVERATGTTPQTNGTSAEPDWREECGYNKFFKHEVIWQQGHYTGDDKDWSQIGIPHSVLSDINKNAKGKYGWHFDVVRDTKYAKITFEDKDDAFWFRLRNKIT